MSEQCTRQEDGQPEPWPQRDALGKWQTDQGTQWRLECRKARPGWRPRQQESCCSSLPSLRTFHHRYFRRDLTLISAEPPPQCFCWSNGRACSTRQLSQYFLDAQTINSGHKEKILCDYFSCTFKFQLLFKEHVLLLWPYKFLSYSTGTLLLFLNSSANLKKNHKVHQEMLCCYCWSIPVTSHQLLH